MLEQDGGQPSDRDRKPSEREIRLPGPFRVQAGQDFGDPSGPAIVYAPDDPGHTQHDAPRAWVVLDTVTGFPCHLGLPTYAEAKARCDALNAGEAEPPTVKAWCTHRPGHCVCHLAT